MRAVEDVSLRLDAGETLGIVGESGSGKSTLALSILRLLPPAARIVRGEIRFEGEDLLTKSNPEMRKVRGKRIAMILQDPMASLNPLFTIGDQVAEPIRVHEGAGRGAARSRAGELLRAVRISSPETRLAEYPHQMSGGMRQRIVGAIAISCEPRLLIADEPKRLAGFHRERDAVHCSHEPGVPEEEAGLHGEVLGEVLDLEHGDVVAHCTPSRAQSQQRAVWSGATVNVGGSSARQRSIAFEHRGWKAQPVGSAAGSGGWPSIAVSRSCAFPSLGIDSRRACV